MVRSRFVRLAVVSVALVALSFPAFASADRPPFKASPHNANLGRIAELGGDAIQVVITNVGDVADTPIITWSPNFGGINPWGSATTCGGSLAPGGTCIVNIAFSNLGTVDPGRYTAWISVASTNTGAVTTVNARATAL